ncbi:hypothetical protein MtrunA17_Chr7g0235721 [Medicago truncatula]|uniref:Uncharacterized protein n=1 Tax=Medicago truncatula TaxID=3880 RepID=A0A396GXH4_MEDTR|nr:hypothetical protein MtrunA17_Chr7g0235721 [Medicago truncatula]
MRHIYGYGCIRKKVIDAQTTSIHAISALLSLPSSSILRDACSRWRNSAYSPRLQFNALDLCLSVSLDRSPSSHNNSGDCEVVSLKLKQIAAIAEECVGPGVIVSFGELKSFVNDDGGFLNGFICTTWWFFSSQSDLRGPLNGSFGCVPHHNQFGEKCEHEVLGASNERFSVSAHDPYPSNLPQWLKTTEFGTTKTLTVKTKDDGVLGDSSESCTPHNNLDDICQVLHQQIPKANTCPTVVGFHCADNKNEDADNHSSKIVDKSPKNTSISTLMHLLAFKRCLHNNPAILSLFLLGKAGEKYSKSNSCSRM